jgi:riboflavin biosynthesis pyrimidine reductase
MPPLDTLFDRHEGRPLPLPRALLGRYGGPLGFPAPRGRPLVFSNFVTTLDGVVSYDIPRQAHAGVISRSSDEDRFVLGLLRACADVVVVGAGTLRAEPDGEWTPDFAYPAAAAPFAALRRAMGKAGQPAVAFVTASGDLDLDAGAFKADQPIVILTTKMGARRLGRHPRNVDVQVMDGPAPSARHIVTALATRLGARRILTEGGPTLMGRFLKDRVLDQMFQTIAPQIAGRSAAHRRLALVEDLAFRPQDAPWSRLLSVKRSADDLLFLRLAVRPQARASSRS